MYPSQTSLIPVTVTLVRFLEENGLRAIFENYPYWYLGVPFRFMSGLVVPALEVLVHKLLPNVSLFNITIYLIIVSFVAGAVGWGLLAYKVQIAKFKVQSLLVFLLLLILPWRYFSAIALGEAPFTIARNLLPYALIAFWSYLKRRNKVSFVRAIIAGAIILLINTSILPIFLVGGVSLCLTFSFKDGKFRKVAKNLKYFLLLTTYSLLLATIWYTPSYWWTILANPSIGGASGIKVIMRIFDILRAGLPLFLAITTVYFSGKVKRRGMVFVLTWTFTFLFLTIFRFIGDYDFWMDWTSWLYELEVGAAFIAAQILNSKLETLNGSTSLTILSLSKDKSQISNSKFQLEKKSPATNYMLLATILLLPFYLVWRVHLALGRPALISKNIPEGVRSLEKLTALAGDDGSTALTTSRVFLSGSTVFWAGSTGASTELSRMSLPLTQVRGGADQGAIHPFWHHAAYQLRDGDSPELAKGWLNALGVSWVLIHTGASSEFYHDFRNINKWKEIGELVWEENGDRIYKISDSFLAWAIDQDKLKRVVPPKDGKDMIALEEYLSTRGEPLGIKREKKGYVIENPDKEDLIQVVVTYNRGWKAYSKEGKRLRIEKDVLGHIIISTNNNQEVFLSY